jgi:TPR repeat protein
MPEEDSLNESAAVAELRAKAEAGDANAQFNLGGGYGVGYGVPQDYAQAAAWYRKAADQGHAGAQFPLGVMYEVGRGVSQDYVEAHKWYSLGASRSSAGNKGQYAGARDEIATKMTPAQIAAAQQRASEWLAAFEQRGEK